MFPRFNITFALTFAVVFMATASATAGDIFLKRSVRIAPDVEHVTLSDIALLRGEAAETYADVVIIDMQSDGEGDRVRFDRAIEVSLAAIRARLTDAGVHWGKVHLTGGNVILRPTRSADTRPPIAMQPLAIASVTTPARDRRSTPDARAAASLLEQPTLAAHITRVMLRGLAIPAENLQLIFDPDDADLLATPESSYRFEIRPLGNVKSDRVEISVNLWKDTVLERRTSLTVRPLIRTTVLTARQDIRRNDPVMPGDIDQQSEWLSPNRAAQMAGSIDSIGTYATRSIRAGDSLRSADLRGTTVVERGDRVIVRCVVGATVIAVEAEARQDGAVGESIEFRKVGERETFTAEVAGPGEAVRRLQR